MQFDARKNLCCHDVTQMPRSPRLFAPIGKSVGNWTCCKCGSDNFRRGEIPTCIDCGYSRQENPAQVLTYPDVKAGFIDTAGMDKPAPAPVAQPKFKVGDRVRCIWPHFTQIQVGDEILVAKVDAWATALILTARQT